LLLLEVRQDRLIALRISSIAKLTGLVVTHTPDNVASIMGTKHEAEITAGSDFAYPRHPVGLVHLDGVKLVDGT
jgi:hypothetical protein